MAASSPYSRVDEPEVLSRRCSCRRPLPSARAWQRTLNERNRRDAGCAVRRTFAGACIMNDYIADPARAFHHTARLDGTKFEPLPPVHARRVRQDGVHVA